MSSVGEILAEMRKGQQEIAAEHAKQDEEHWNKILHSEDTRREHKAQIASRLHLLDLKRAGHSPRFTEFNVPHDNIKPFTFYGSSTPLSLYGSPALLCAEIASP